MTIESEMDLKMGKYLRGEPVNLEGLKDKKLKGQLSVREDLYGKSAKAAAKAEKWLMPSEGGYLEGEGIEKTWRFRQEAIAREVDISSSKNQFDVVLPELGPYTLDYTSSGRYMALAGRKGHLAVVDMSTMAVVKELQVGETVRDVAFLHNELFFAAAQKKYTYVYNRDGTELHCLKEHGKVLKLQFLKNHFLLASINNFGELHYQDVSTGAIVGNYRTAMGRTNVMKVNHFNGIVALGQSRGSVTMWRPTSSNPVIRMLCHHGPVSALAFHPNGHLMATAGMEKKIKIWDLRKFEVLQTLPGHAKTLEFSQKGLLAMGTGSFVQVLKDSSGTFHNYGRYMNHSMVKGFQIKKVAFRPYEDVLGMGHSMGLSSILIPGSGEANFDSWVANPYETPKQRREKEVKSLLDKLPPETIMLDPAKLGTVRAPKKRVRPTKEHREAEMEAAKERAKEVPIKNKTKGRNKPSKRAKKREEIVMKAKKPYLDQEKEDQQELARIKKQKTSDEYDLPKSLQRLIGHKKAD